MPYKDPVVARSKTAERQARYRARHPERHAQSQAKYVAKHGIERIRAIGRASYHKRRSENPIQVILSRKRAEARRQHVKFNLNEEWYLAHYSQGCEVTGRDFESFRDFGVSGGSRGPWYPEIDRIKPGGDYTMDNCRLVCAIYNQAKKDWDDASVLEMIRLVIQHRPSDFRSLDPPR